MLRASLLGVGATNDLGAVVQGLLGVEGTLCVCSSAMKEAGGERLMGCVECVACLRWCLMLRCAWPGSSPTNQSTMHAHT